MVSQPGAVATAVICILGFGSGTCHAAQCGCLGEHALEAVFGAHAFMNISGQLCLPQQTSAGIVACYPTHYGSNCSAWDARLPSTCATMEGDVIPHRPAWCNDAWCFVDTSSDPQCNPKFPSVFFPDRDLYYSYQTCGSSNSFVDHDQESVTSMITVVEDYVKSSVSTLVEAWHAHDGSQGGWWGRRRTCSVVTGCGCNRCDLKSEGPWQYASVDFDNSVFYRREGSQPTVAIEECMVKMLNDEWETTAAKEEANKRFGYLYAGFQSDGSSAAWPAVKWCPGPLDTPLPDFRFRPWYVSAASGPKDVVLVIDTSGSMRNERETLARAAASAVIDTLVDVDHAVIVAFSSGARSNSLVLQPMTKTNRDGAKAWISTEINAYGGTLFKAGFTKAFDILTTSRDQGVTAGCKTLMLFLSDGDPSDWDGDSYAWLQRKNEEVGDTVIFTYALGSGLSSSGLAINKRIACENRGIFHKVSDGSDLGSIMANYFTYMGVGADSAKVRWRNYMDAITGKELLSGCLPAFDKRTSPRKLIGVSCMDVNTVVDLDDLKTADGYADFAAQIVNQQKYCAPFRLSHWDIQMIRHEYSEDSVCDTDSGVDEVRCGDGSVDANPVSDNIERCDDGNAVSGDGCSDTCQVEDNWVCPKYGYKLLTGDFIGWMERPYVYCHGKDLPANSPDPIGSATEFSQCRQGTTVGECAYWCGRQATCKGFNWYDSAWGISNACCFRERASTKEYHTNTECYEKVAARNEAIQCSDVAGFVDELKFKCHEWVGYQCDSATTAYGYSAAGQDALEANCPSSCGICAGDTCHVDCATMVNSPESCQDCKGEWSGWSACQAPNIVVYGGEIQCVVDRVYEVSDFGQAGGAPCPAPSGAIQQSKIGIFDLKDWKPDCLRKDNRAKLSCGAGVREREVECIADDPLVCSRIEAQVTWVTEKDCLDAAGCEWETPGCDPTTGCCTNIRCESGVDEDCGVKPRPTNNGCFVLVNAAYRGVWASLAIISSMCLAIIAIA